MATPVEKNKPTGTEDGFVILPNPIARMATVSFGARMLFGVIWSLRQGARHHCYASNRYLAARLGTKDRNLHYLLAELERSKLIKRELTKNRQRSELIPLWTGGVVILEEPPKPKKKRRQKRGSPPLQDPAGGPARSCRGACKTLHTPFLENKVENKVEKSLESSQALESSSRNTLVPLSPKSPSSREKREPTRLGRPVLPRDRPRARTPDEVEREKQRQLAALEACRARRRAIDLDKPNGQTP